MEGQKATPQKALTVFMLTMINVATIGSVKNWPLIAEYGFSSIFFFFLATLIFFIPVSLVSAELATGWPQLGGVFAWVKEAFGSKVGFLAAWLLWVQNIVWYPTALSFIAAAIAYTFKPSLATHPLYTFLTVFSLFWAITLVNFNGMRTSGWISSIGTLFGTFLPGIFIIFLGALWLLGGNISQIPLNVKALIPDLSSFGELVLFTGVLISLAGMEMSAVHARDVDNPKKNYPRAIFFSALLVLGLSIPGVLSIAIAVPQKEISLLAGSLQAISLFLKQYHLEVLMPLFSLLIAIGTTTSVSTWTVGPCKGLLAAAEGGELPPFFCKVNKKGMPTALLLVQAVIVSVLSLLFVFLPTLNEAFWMLLALVSELYLLMYLLLFAAAIKLRYKRPHVSRPYKVFGGKIGIWGVCLVGMLSCILTMIVGIFPPRHIPIGDLTTYFGLMGGGLTFFLVFPFFISK